ncbi:hypothetical protein VSDG_03001 [Cytospora chrysosperma]|uniref:Ipa protein n=1 Tax=Cytospora chrysosperma TaxID=252740 RepID=A0A423W8W4_CYTCH|nr:hypothetical protein VSDG_03001 [Valsa sordida]
MAQPDSADVVKDLHQDLARKYRLHGSKVEEIWTSFDKAQRTKAMKAGAADGVVLKHRMDPTLGNVSKIIPEWNLKDITEPGSDFLLQLLRHRATQPLMHQYAAGMRPGEPGDHGFIDEMMRTRNLRHVDSFKDCWSFFMSDEDYGTSYRVTVDREVFLSEVAKAVQARVCIPQETGELVITRQMQLLQALTIIMDDILELGSTTRTRKERPQKKNTDATATALEKLSIKARPPKLSLPDLLEIASEQKASMSENLDLLCTEPVVLAHSVNIWFYSRPELVADEKGRLLPVHTDKYISGAFFEAIHNTVKAAAIWNYISGLLELLQDTADKVYRAIILQEISNTCHLEYGRTQALFKRQVQSAMGSKYFKRMSNMHENGAPRVLMKVKPESLTRENPQLHYVLRLCQGETSAAKAADWMDKLETLHKSYPIEREKLQEREFNALGDLAVAVAFIQDLSPGISLPPLSRNKGQLFVSRTRALETELNGIKSEIDLTDFVAPIDNLLEPGMAEKALNALDRFIIEQAGSKLGFLYQDLIEDCFSDLEKQYEKVKSRAQQSKAGFVPLPQETTQTSTKLVEQRRQKEKSRPAHSSVYEIAPPAGNEHFTKEEAQPRPEKIKVKASTAEAFFTLFSKSESRGTVSWAAFEAAMADLGFSVLPKFGSVYTFSPPETMKAKKSLTLHRPHKSNIEGWSVPTFARRLNRVYGWDENTFEVA